MHKGNDGSGSGFDADSVDGIAGSSFLRSDTDDTFSGGLVSSSRDEGIFGTYDSYKTDHIWSMGTGYKNHSSGTNFGNLYGLAYKHTNNSTGGTMGGSHQMVWCGNGESKGAIGYSCVWHRTAMKVTTSNHLVWHAGNDGSGSGLDADLWDGDQKSTYLDQAVLTISSPTFNNIYSNAWIRNNDSTEGLYNTANSTHWYSSSSSYWDMDNNGSNGGIRFRDNHQSTIRGYFYYNNSNNIGILNNGGSWIIQCNANKETLFHGHVYPSGSKNLGSSSMRWNNIYVNDLQLSNESKKDEGGNDVDGTWGNWTLQEGDENIFMINNRSGKKYKIALQEV